MANRSLSSVMYDPGGLALSPPTDPGGMALPAPTDPGGMALPAPEAPRAQMPAWQNPASAMAPGAIANAPRIFDNVLYEHGDTRQLQPNELAAAQGYVEDFWRKYGANNGNTWGSGDAAVDPYMGQIPFPAGTVLDPALMKEGVNYGGEQTYQPGPYQTFSSGPYMPGSMRGAIGGAMSGPMMGRYGSAIGGAAGGLFGAFGGGSGGAQTIAQRWRGGNRTLGDVTSSPGGMDSSYGDPTLLR